MTVVPKPKQVVRVMVGRVELMTPERERQAEAAVRSLADPDGPRRVASVRLPERAGPLRRTDHPPCAEDHQRRQRTRSLPAAALDRLRHGAACGDPQRERWHTSDIDPHAAAGSSCPLLRDIGLDKEARSEGTAILNELERIGSSADTSPANQSMMQQLRDIRAAALEASGIDRSAAVVYADCIESPIESMRTV